MRHAFRLFIKAGMEEEYDKRHQAVYPELLQVFQDVGIQTYSIYRDGTELFGYMDVDTADLAETQRKIDEHPANIRWQAFMKDLFDESRPNFRVMPEVFHFEPK